MLDTEILKSGMSMQLATSEPRVLLIDDNQSLLEVLTDFLTNNGLKVFSAASAESGLELLEASAPDLIVCDVMMPGIDGYEFYRKLRADDRWSDIPFIYLTALTGSHEVCLAKELGCDDYLAKPFLPEELLAAIKGKVNVFKERVKNRQLQDERNRKRIINTLSHELRTPLVAINTGTELLLEQRDDLSREKIEYLLQTIQRGGLRLQRLIEDFILVQQIDNGGAAKQQQKFCRNIPAEELVELAIDMYQDFKNNTQIEIKFDWPDEQGPEVNVYAMQVADALFRIIANACKFGPTDTIVTIRGEVDNKFVKISVEDQGPGLDEDVIQQACERFAQIDRDRYEQQGCGLGLPIANYLTVLNGGELQFENRTGGGLKVTLAFPIVD